jgi:indole-3-glycerol phosphate synthase
MSVLAEIIAYKRAEVSARKAAKPWRVIEQEASAQARPLAFQAALSACVARPALIAEIKKASPSRGVIRADFDPAALAKAYWSGGAACLSVLTDAPSFQGHESFLAVAREVCPLPILRKDFIVDPWQVAESRAIGADAILIIMAALDDAAAMEIHTAANHWGMDALAEVHDEAELERALLLGPQMIGINNRSLATFETSLKTTERLAPRIPRDRLIVSESGIFTPSDLARLQHAGAGAFLVGEALMRQEDVSAATRALLGT